MKIPNSIFSVTVEAQTGASKENKNKMKESGGGAMLDLDTDLQTGFKTFQLNDVYINDGDNNRITDCKLAPGSKFSVIFDGVGNFSLKDGKVYPKLSIMLHGGHDNIMIHEDDLFGDQPDCFLPEEATVLRATVNVSEPITRGEYFLSITVTDQNNKDANIISTWSFNVK